MFGQVLRVKGYYDVENVYDLIDLRVGRAHLKGLAPNKVLNRIQDS